MTIEENDILDAESHASVSSVWRTVLLGDQPFFFEMGSIGAVIDYAVKNSDGFIIKQGSLELNYHTNNAEISVVDTCDIPRIEEVSVDSAYDIDQFTKVTFRFLPTVAGLMFQYRNILEEDIDILFKSTILYHIPGLYVAPTRLISTINVSSDALGVVGTTILTATMIVQIDSEIDGSRLQSDILADVDISADIAANHGVAGSVTIPVIIQISGDGEAGGNITGFISSGIDVISTIEALHGITGTISTPLLSQTFSGISGSAYSQVAIVVTAAATTNQAVTGALAKYIDMIVGIFGTHGIAGILDGDLDLTSTISGVLGATDAPNAPIISLAVGPTTYPPEINCSLDESVMVGDAVVLQWSSVYDFSTIMGEATNTIDIGEATANEATFVGLSGISSGSHFFRARVERGAQISSWSNVVNHGDTVAPSFTSSNSPSVAELTVNPTGVLTFDEPISLVEIIGGTDAGLFSVTGSTWTLNATPDFETKTSYTVIFRATDYAGNSTTQTMTLTITNVDETPDAFAFTDQTGATISSVVTSNAITIAGLGSGVATPITISGASAQYRKNGGSWTSSAGTVANGDTVELRVTTSSSYLTAINVILNIGGVTDTWTVTTEADASIPAPVLTSPSGTATNAGTASLSVSSDVANGVIYMVVTSSATKPSASQIKAGQDHTGAAAAAKSSRNMLATGTQSFNVFTLTANTTYYTHYYQEDNLLRGSNIATTSSFTTAATYTGPGDISTYSFWTGLRAYSAATVGLNLVRLRRASDDAVQDFASTASGNLDTAAIKTWAAGSNVYVERWYNRGPSGVNMPSSSNAVQAQLIIEDTGFAYAHFVAANSTNYANISMPSHAQPRSLSFLGRRWQKFTDYSGVGLHGLTWNNTANRMLIVGGAVPNVDVPDNQFVSMNFLLNGTSSILNANGTESPTFNGGSGGWGGGTSYLGVQSGGYGDFDFLEAGASSSAHDGTMRANLNANMRGYWGI